MATTATLRTAATLPFAARPSLGPIAWAPEESRQLVWRQFAGPASKGRGATPLPLLWPQHPAGGLLDYGLLFDEPIAAAKIAVTPSDLQAISLFAVGNLLLFWLNGGTGGSTYTLAGTVNTVAGRIITFSGNIAAQTEPAAPAPTYPAPTLQGTTPLGLAQFFSVINGLLVVNVTALPTSPLGLPSGAMWNNGGIPAFA